MVATRNLFYMVLKYLMQTNRVLKLNPYKPGEQLTGDYIKLNANENPYPAARGVTDSLANFIINNPKKFALYPDPDSNELRGKIADMLNFTGGVLCRTNVNGEVCTPCDCDKLPFRVTRDMIYTGNGSDEVLSFLFYGFIEGSCVTTSLTYSFYPVYCSYYGVKRIIIPTLFDGVLDCNKIMDAAVTNDAPIIFTNPNAPTGAFLNRHCVKQMLRVLRTRGYKKPFIIDEAYCDFGGESCIGLLNEYPNLIIVRTFSKSLAAAGVRLGYVVAAPDVIKTLHTVKNCVNHFPLDIIAQKIGIAIIENLPYYVDCAKKVAATRDSFIKFLKDNNVFVIPSSANFVLAKFRDISGLKVYETIKEHGVLVRHFDDDTREWVRITIGTDKEMEILKKIIKESLVDK